MPRDRRPRRPPRARARSSRCCGSSPPPACGPRCGGQATARRRARRRRAARRRLAASCCASAPPPARCSRSRSAPSRPHAALLHAARATARPVSSNSSHGGLAPPAHPSARSLRPLRAGSRTARRWRSSPHAQDADPKTNQGVPMSKSKRELREQRRAATRGHRGRRGPPAPRPPPAWRLGGSPSSPPSRSSPIVDRRVGARTATPAPTQTRTRPSSSPASRSATACSATRRPRSPSPSTSTRSARSAPRPPRPNLPGPDRQLRQDRQGQARGAHDELPRPGLGQAAKVAAGAKAQGKLWAFLETFYASQGTENSGYVTDDFLTSVATTAGVERRQGARVRRHACRPGTRSTTADAAAQDARRRLHPHVHDQARATAPRRSSRSASTT